MKKRFLGLLLAVCLAVLPLLTFTVSAAETASPSLWLERSEVYTYLREQLSTGATTIPLSAYNLTADLLTGLMQDIRYTSPELFFVDTRYGYSLSGGTIVSLFPQYTLSEEDLTAAQEGYTGYLETLYALADDDWSNFETALFYHDFLAANYEYDTSYSIYDAYGFLKNQKGVCQAYTLTYTALMDHFGIPCTYVSSENMNHIWNAVYVDGSWYHLDVTHDDPVYDREGQVKHDYFLSGSLTTAEKKAGATDMVVGGAGIVFSENNHPFYELLCTSNAAIVEGRGKWYGIFADDSSAWLSEIDFDSAVTVKADTGLSVRWRIPQVTGSAYLGNFSALCTDGDYLYYHSDSEIYAYDLSAGKKVKIYTCEETTTLYGLQLREGQLVAYCGVSPNVAAFTPLDIPVDLPAYYTITWIVEGQEPYITYAIEGSNPLESFNGSTYREDKNGMHYVFKGWSPELVTVGEDTTYTALYQEILLYKPGDINDDGTVTIADVTALLEYLSGNSASVNEAALDTNGDGFITISDVTALLEYLSDSSFVIY